jgi:hypothetical protein
MIANTPVPEEELVNANNVTNEDVNIQKKKSRNRQIHTLSSSNNSNNTRPKLHTIHSSDASNRFPILEKLENSMLQLSKNSKITVEAVTFTGAEGINNNNNSVITVGNNKQSSGGSQVSISL